MAAISMPLSRSPKCVRKGRSNRRIPRIAMWVTPTIVTMVLAACGVAGAAESNATSGLPIPRFVSLKSDKVNVRAGPTKDHDVAWVYNRAALPVEVTAEFENWRRIRDWEGAEGWVYHSLLSGKRTALVAPQSKKKDELLELRDKLEAISTAPTQAAVRPSIHDCFVSVPDPMPWSTATGQLAYASQCTARHAP